jgi:hypothetical protein
LPAAYGIWIKKNQQGNGKIRTNIKLYGKEKIKLKFKLKGKTYKRSTQKIKQRSEIIA